MQIKKIFEKIFGTVVYEVCEYTYNPENMKLCYVDRCSDIFRTKEAAEKELVSRDYHTICMKAIVDNGIARNCMVWQKPDGCGGYFYAKVNKLRPKK